MTVPVITDYDASSGCWTIRCDTETFERIRDAVCRKAGVVVPLTVPPAPVRAVSIVLASDAPPPRVEWARQVAAMTMLTLMAAGPLGLIALVRGVMSW